MTTRLVRPDVSLRSSWAEAVAEWDDGPGMHGSGLWGFDDPIDVTEDGCREIVDLLLAEEHIEGPGPGGDGKVPCTYFWIVDDARDGTGRDEFVGYVALRHYLNAWLLEEGGHIGYSVRPSRRREGHATRALLLALDQAAGLGMDRVLVTADEDNVPSQQVITGAGGVYEDTRQGKRRYWIDTAVVEGDEMDRRRLGSPTVHRGGQ